MRGRKVEISLIILACVISTGGLCETPDERRNNNADAVRAAVANISTDLSQLKSAKKPDCKSDKWTSVMAVSESILSLASAQQSTAKLSADIAKLARTATTSIEAQLDADSAKQSATAAVDTRLMIADTALDMKCFDVADKNYRYVMATFTGTGWEPYRDRAKIGIDDVRARRK